MDSEAVGLAVDHLLEKFSDNSEAEIGLITKRETRKRKHAGSQTDVSCSSSGSGSPLNIPYCLGYIGKDYSENESGDEWNSDGSRPRSISRLPGYHSATTAVVSDSEDEVDYPIDVTDLDTFSVEYEPPETNSEDEADNSSNSDEEQVIIIPSSSEDEDPGADGGDEYDVESDSDDSWECAECWTMNHPLTTKCLMCWKERKSQTALILNSLSDIKAAVEPSKASNPTVSDTKSATNVLLEKTAVSLSRSSSSCSSTQASSDSGICVSSCETDVNDCIVLSSAHTTSHRLLRNEPSKPLQIIIEPLQNETLLNGPSKDEVSQDGPSENEALLSGPTKNEPLLHGPSKNEPLQNEALQNVSSRHEPSLNEPLYTKTGVSTSRNDAEKLPSNSCTVDDNLNLCVICSVEPRNASIIHGRSGHQVCCITCAEKLKADRKRCPVCRRRIHLVIKNFL